MVKVRRYSETDSGHIKDLITGIMGQEFGDAAEAYPTNDIEDISKNYGALGEAFFVAVDGDKVVGTVAIKKEDDRIALLRRLFVAAPYRRQKIGVLLLDEALKFCEQVGYTEVIFKTTSKMSRAIELCQKKGFSQRAKLELGAIELLKYSLSLRDGVQTS